MIVVENLSKAFGETEALKGISLEVSQDEILALVGPSGCGKSTLLRIIAGLERPDIGSVLIEGDVVSSPGGIISPAKRKLAMIFQDLALWPHMTVEAHLRFVFKSKQHLGGSLDAYIREMINAVGLDGQATRYPPSAVGR